MARKRLMLHSSIRRVKDLGQLVSLHIWKDNGAHVLETISTHGKN